MIHNGAALVPDSKQEIGGFLFALQFQSLPAWKRNVKMLLLQALLFIFPVSPSWILYPPSGNR